MVLIRIRQISLDAFMWTSARRMRSLTWSKCCLSVYTIKEDGSKVGRWCVLFASSVQITHPPHRLRETVLGTKGSHTPYSSISRRGSRANPQLDAAWPRSHGSLGRQFLVFLRHPHGLSRRDMVECKERSGFSACLHVTFLYVTVCILLQVMNAYYAYQFFVATDFLLSFFSQRWCGSQCAVPGFGIMKARECFFSLFFLIHDYSNNNYTYSGQDHLWVSLQLVTRRSNGHSQSLEKNIKNLARCHTAPLSELHLGGWNQWYLVPKWNPKGDCSWSRCFKVCPIHLFQIGSFAKDVDFGVPRCFWGMWWLPAGAVFWECMTLALRALVPGRCPL